MPKGFREIVRFECDASKTSAELRSPTIAVLGGFDDEEMTRQQLQAAVKMLQMLASRMEDAPEDDEAEDDEADDDAD